MAPASVNGVRTTIWPALRHLDDAGRHRRVEAQRRARVDDGHQRRLALELRPVDAARDPAHLDPVADPAPAQRVGVGGLVGQRVDVAQRLEVADVGRDVDRLDRVAAGQVQDVEGTGRASGSRGSRPGCPGRRPRSRSEQLGGLATGENIIHSPPTSRSRAGLRACMREPRRRLGDGVQDQPAVGAHALAVDLAPRPPGRCRAPRAAARPSRSLPGWSATPRGCSRARRPRPARPAAAGCAAASQGSWVMSPAARAGRRPRRSPRPPAVSTELMPRLSFAWLRSPCRAAASRRSPRGCCGWPPRRRPGTAGSARPGWRRCACGRPASRASRSISPWLREPALSAW